WNSARNSPRVVFGVATLILFGSLVDRLRLYVGAWSVATALPSDHLLGPLSVAAAGVADLGIVIAALAATALLVLRQHRAAVRVSHACVMISAILRLTHAEWRRPITRSAEVLAVFSLMTAGLFPIIHSGRLWRTAYWIFPYDFNRGVWPDVRSALIWDPSAIVTDLPGPMPLL